MTTEHNRAIAESPFAASLESAIAEQITQDLNNCYIEKLAEYYERIAYHSDWNLLIGVVTKIAELEKQHMDSSYHFGKVLLLPITTPIHELYAAVVQFVNWHKKNNDGTDNTK